MEEFAYAGGVPGLITQLRDRLHLDSPTVSGLSLGDSMSDGRVDDEDVIRPWGNPVQPAGSGTAVLRGNIAPDGAVIKISAASAELLEHEGPAIVFDSIEDYQLVVNDDDLQVTEDSVIVVRNAGPRGYPGMPEIGNLAIPKKLLDRGVRDIVRICDARMSGTAYGTCVLHVAPESAVGGPLALIRTGDVVRLDVKNRRLEMLVSDEELAARRAKWVAPPPPSGRGWTRLYTEHVQQADRGADLDFLVGGSGDRPGRIAF
jgi:dihydroxy-acid dehydratase